MKKNLFKEVDLLKVGGTGLGMRKVGGRVGSAKLSPAGIRRNYQPIAFTSCEFFKPDSSRTFFLPSFIAIINVLLPLYGTSQFIKYFHVLLFWFILQSAGQVLVPSFKWSVWKQNVWWHFSKVIQVENSRLNSTHQVVWGHERLHTELCIHGDHK